MKSLVTTAIAACLCVPALAGQMQPSGDLKKVEWMLGKWTGAGTSMFPGMEGNISCSAHVKALDGGWWYEMNMVDKYPQFESSAKMMLTYDPMAKHWMSVYVNYMGPDAIKSYGQIKGNTLSMTSEETNMEGMKTRFRTDFKMLDSKTMDFTLWMQMGKDWNQVQHATYRRK